MKNRQLNVSFNEEDRKKIGSMAHVSGLSEAAVVRQAFRIAILKGWMPVPDAEDNGQQGDGRQS